MYLGLSQLPFEELQGFSVAALALLQPLELLPQLPLEKKTENRRFGEKRDPSRWLS